MALLKPTRFADHTSPGGDPHPSWGSNAETVAQVAPAQAMARLNDVGRKFTILVFGDSTGISSSGWQVLFPKWIGDMTDRPVTVTPWNRDEVRWNASWGIRLTGAHASVNVWNGSAPARDIAYARAHLEAMTTAVDPADVDLVFVNFGHTEVEDGFATRCGLFMLDMAAKFPGAAVIYLKQNPNLSGSPLVVQQRHNVANMEDNAVRLHFASVPVYDAFMDQPDTDALLDVPTQVHPNTDGYRLWTSVMVDTFTPWMPGLTSG
ncbi:MAG: SGNH/GDSL hydrolase family protein [Nakamurella sp.]